MNQLEMLLESYKEINEKLAQSNAMNEKIYRQMMIAKPQNKLSSIRKYDYFGLTIAGLLLIFILRHIFIFRNDVLLLIPAFVALISWIIIFWLSVNQLLVLNKIDLANDSIQISLQKVSVLLSAYRKSRTLSVIVVIPFTLGLIPMGWILRDIHYYYFIQSNYFLIDYLPLLISTLLIGIVFIWWLMKVTYFNWVADIQKSLKELQE